jgi:hypothetical protein
MQSNAAKRARKLARPDWDKEAGRSDSDFAFLLEEEQLLNETVDFSFDYHYKGSGKWDRNSHKIAVPDRIGAGVLGENRALAPEKSTDIIPITAIQVQQILDSDEGQDG